jgi:hypothetical protein
VVVDDIEKNAQAGSMACIHKPLERVWPTVMLVSCEESNAVISSPLLTGPTGYRHDLNRCHAQVCKVGQMLDGPVEGAPSAEVPMCSSQMIEPVLGEPRQSLSCHSNRE